MNYTVLRGFCLGSGIDLHPGDTTELTPEQAELFVRQGRLQPKGAAASASVDMGKASLLASISMAGSIDELGELVGKQQTDPEIIAAYDKRSNELDLGD